MAAPTEIIVYRNPMEKAMWDFWMNSETGSAIIVYLCGAAAIFLALYVLNAMLGNPWDKVVRRVRGNGRRGYYNY